MDARVAPLFVDASRTSAAHRKALISLTNILRGATLPQDASLVASAFNSCIDRVLVIWKSEPVVERVCSFVVQAVMLEHGRLLLTTLEASSFEICQARRTQSTCYVTT